MKRLNKLNECKAAELLQRRSLQKVRMRLRYGGDKVLEISRTQKSRGEKEVQGTG